MPTITFDYLDPDGDPTDAPTKGALRAHLYEREIVTGKYRTVATFLIPLVEGHATAVLSQTGANQCWVVKELAPIAGRRTFYKAVGAVDAAFTALVDVNPETFEPIADNPSVADAIAAAVAGEAGERVAADALKADLVGGVVPDSQLDERLSVDGLNGTFGALGMSAPIATGATPTRAASTGIEAFPTLEKLPDVVLPFASQAAPSMLWLCPVDMRGWPGALDNIYLFYSTDHGESSGTNGIYLATASDPTGTNLVARGSVWAVEAGIESQAETPTVWLDWDAGLIRMLHQVNTGIAVGSFTKQETRMATSATGLSGSWTNAGVCMTPAARTPSDPHTGYAGALERIGNTMSCYTLQGGGGFTRWTSISKGLPGTWIADARRITRDSDQICTLAGWTFEWYVKWFLGNVIDYRGRRWWVGPIGLPAGGGAVVPAKIYTAPLTPDGLHFAGTPRLLDVPLLPWEDADPDGWGPAFTYDGDTFIPFRSGGQQGDFGFFKIVRND